MLYKCNNLKNIINDKKCSKYKWSVNMIVIIYIILIYHLLILKNITNMNDLLYNCNNLSNIDLSSFDNKNI